MTTPVCGARQSHRQGDSRRVNECWLETTAPIRSLGPSCTVLETGALACRPEWLRQAPSGRFISVDDDGFDACAVSETGRVACWGLDASSWPEIPDSFKRSVTWRGTPADVQFKSVSVGSTSPYHLNRVFACGIDMNDDVLCWEHGQEADHWKLAGPFAKVEAGARLACTLSTGGRVQCWEGRVLARDGWPDISGDRRFEDVALGRNTLCLIDTTHHGTCWYLRLEDDRDRPIALGRVVQVRAGAGQACGLRPGGQIVCWGDPRPPPTIRLTYLSQPGFDEAYCGLTTKGETYCWGDPSPTLPAASGRSRP